VTIVFSDDQVPLDWSEARRSCEEFGVKGASSLALPRKWTLPFAVISTAIVGEVSANRPLSDVVPAETVARIRALAGDAGRVIVRSSVVGESIWERGTYLSVDVDAKSDDFTTRLDDAATRVIESAAGKSCGLMIQKYISPASQGEFGNLQRISKTRDQWEISATDRSGGVYNLRLNSQRDAAADPIHSIFARSGISQERLFGSIAAWINNELLRGKSQRVTCEWVTDNRQFYIVQIDEEDEDLWGANPFQLRILPTPNSDQRDGIFLKRAQGGALESWDKLKVLTELWEEGSKHKPVLYYVRLADLPVEGDLAGRAKLVDDFTGLLGEGGIVVRTSVAAGGEKVTNLPRTECMSPEAATAWCLATAQKLASSHGELTEYAFVAHRFVAARSAAWVRADPTNPIVEIHSLWGLPDALQYCPYDTWEVHVPTQVATDYPEYKPEMLVATDDGGWQHARVKNEVARANSIGSTEAKEIAARSLAIADRMGHACHIMWFVGCVDNAGTTFNMPWYWTKPHEAEGNIDRSSYSVFQVADESSLSKFKLAPRFGRRAIALRPNDLKLMRDNGFIERVGRAAREAGVPVILSGSTLAHAYYQLRLIGCAVVTPSRKERSRIRRTANLGKLVRDKIPTRIAARQEFEVTKQVPASLIKGFLISKLLEEALETREAIGAQQKREELADLFEVVRALAKSEGFSLAEIEAAADGKREKAGGFEQGLVLLQTGIASGERSTSIDPERLFGQVLADQTADDTVELPFSFFGFMEIDQPRSILFEHFGIRVDVVLRPDRIELRVVRSSEQLALELDEPLPGASMARDEE